MMDVTTSIREYILENIDAFYEEELQDDDNIFEKGFVTSIFAMQLLDYIESKFDVTIPDDYITLANFSSVNNMKKMIGELKDAVDE